MALQGGEKSATFAQTAVMMESTSAAWSFVSADGSSWCAIRIDCESCTSRARLMSQIVMRKRILFRLRIHSRGTLFWLARHPMSYPSAAASRLPNGVPTMKRIVILIAVVALFATSTGCRRGLCRRNRCAPAPVYSAPVCPPTCVPACPPTVVQSVPACQCAPMTVPTTVVPTTTVPAQTVPSLGTEYTVPGTTIQTVPMSSGSGTVYGSQLPLPGQLGMTVVGDRAVEPGVSPSTVKVGQK